MKTNMCWIRWMLAPVALITLGTFASGCAKQQAAPPARPAVPVVVGTVIQKMMPVQISAVGNVEAVNSVSIRSQVIGEVKEVRFKDGDFVKQGQLLFIIDPRGYQAALAQAQATLARDKSTGVYNRVMAVRYKSLFEQGVVPAQQVDSFVSLADSSDAIVGADEAAVKTAEVNLSLCSIYAPIDGRAGTILVKPGNMVKVVDVPIVVINKIDPIYVNFPIPQQFWSDIKDHIDHGSLRVSAIIPRDPGPPAQGTLTFAENAVDATTGTIHLRGTFDNKQNRLWPGLFVNVMLTVSEQANATVVPTNAIVTRQQDSYVYVVKENNTVEQRTITPGRTVDVETVVDKGLQPGETVVIDGQVNLVPNARVQIKNVNAGPSVGRSDQQAGAAGSPAGKASGAGPADKAAGRPDQQAGAAGSPAGKAGGAGPADKAVGRPAQQAGAAVPPSGNPSGKSPRSKAQ